MAVVTASVTVGFAKNSDSGSGSLSAEIDSRSNGLNHGITSFPPGSSVAILLYAGDSVSGIKGVCSSGSLSSGSYVDVEQEEQIVLAMATTFSTSRPISGNYTITWYGGSANLTKTGDSTFTSATPVVAVGSIKYKSQAQVWMLGGVPYNAAVVVFTGTTP